MKTKPIGVANFVLYPPDALRVLKKAVLVRRSNRNTSLPVRQ